MSGADVLKRVNEAAEPEAGPSPTVEGETQMKVNELV